MLLACGSLCLLGAVGPCGSICFDGTICLLFYSCLLGLCLGYVSAIIFRSVLVFVLLRFVLGQDIVYWRWYLLLASIFLLMLGKLCFSQFGWLTIF